MKTNNNIPAYRFQGYTDAWELRKLGEVVEVCSGRDYKHLGVGSIPVYGTGGYMLSVSEALSKNNDAIGIGRKGTIDSPYILRAPFWTVDTLFYCIPNDGFTLEFAYSIFQNINWKSMDESTGVPSLSKNGINNVKVLTPKIKEQSAIGTFFSTLDRHITLHQCKLDTLKEQKKTYLKLLFPAKGQTKPALCFQGFEDDWEEVKLGEIVVWEKGSGLSKSDLNIEDRGGKVIHYADLYRYKEVITEIFHSSESIEGKAIPLNSLLFPMSDVTPQGLARASSISIEGVRAGGDILIANIKDNSSIFLSYQVNANYRYILPLVTGTTVRHISSTSLSTIPISLPSLPEQEAIGTFFQTLDQEIAQVEDKLASLKEMKKTLLRKLFA
ncbi:TPA: restriction endonuclease subunit S [Streptococcus suis]